MISHLTSTKMITSKSKMDGVYFFDPPSNTVVYGGMVVGWGGIDYSISI